ncbi:hypothetical protein NM208_g14962 [Fusarium decemcellulare]|uniref:Uncharacterized protein n=1 Tax=Fusarium decemcellulare TaxID=57161 RepID=A0ACC1RG81_9HYPO|nr:hypothetical protein NM208_g14962 [Fusarium decemcellulare]
MVSKTRWQLQHVVVMGQVGKPQQKPKANGHGHGQNAIVAKFGGDEDAQTSALPRFFFPLQPQRQGGAAATWQSWLPALKSALSINDGIDGESRVESENPSQAWVSGRLEGQEESRDIHPLTRCIIVAKRHMARGSHEPHGHASSLSLPLQLQARDMGLSNMHISVSQNEIRIHRRDRKDVRKSDKLHDPRAPQQFKAPVPGLSSGTAAPCRLMPLPWARVPRKVGE